MLDQNKIEIIKKEFEDAKSDLFYWLDFSRKVDEDFFNVKLAFLAFLGVIFSIIFSNSGKFSDGFLLFFLADFILIILLLFNDLYIYHTAAVADENKFDDYAREAEERLQEFHVLSDNMENKIPIDEIRKKMNKNEKFPDLNFYLWVVSILFIPCFFLLNFCKLI